MIPNETKTTELSKDIFCINGYDEKRPARIPDALYDFRNVRFEIRNIRYFRLLVTISQNVVLQDANPNLFQYQDYAIKRKDLIKYLGLSTTKRNYSLIKELDEEINKNMPYFKMVKRGPKGESFINLYWFDYFGYDAEKDMIIYKLTETSKRFITSLQRYNKVTPYIANMLNNEVQAWLYPWLKSAVNLERMMEVEIAELKAQLIKDTDKIYDEKKYANATTRFLNKVLGVRKAKNGSSYVKFSYTYVEMEVIKENQESSKSINYINELTDIYVQVWAKRQGRKYVGLAFDVKLKEDFVEQENLNMEKVARPVRKPRKHVEIDCIKRDYKKIQEETMAVQNLFNQMPTIMQPNEILSVKPAERLEMTFVEMKQRWIEFVNKDMECATELNSVGRFAAHMGYKLDETKMVYYK